MGGHRASRVAGRAPPVGARPRARRRTPARGPRAGWSVPDVLARAVRPIAHALHPPTLRIVLRLALPVVAANLLQTLVNVVDVFMAGRPGPLEVAAGGLADSVRL